jgi:hypothetical protein
VHGNKIRKLWKLLAKNDMLESASYEFRNHQACRVRDCGHQSATAMELFRHIRYHTVSAQIFNNDIRGPFEKRPETYEVPP